MINFSFQCRIKNVEFMSKCPEIQTSQYKEKNERLPRSIRS